MVKSGKFWENSTEMLNWIAEFRVIPAFLNDEITEQLNQKSEEYSVGLNK